MNHYQFFCINDELFVKAVKNRKLLPEQEEYLNSYLDIVKYFRSDPIKTDNILEIFYSELFKDNLPSTETINIDPCARMVMFLEASTFDVYNIVVKPYFPFKYQRLMKATGASDLKNFVSGEDIAEFLEVIETCISELTAKFEKEYDGKDWAGWNVELDTMRQGVSDTRAAILDGFKDRIVIFT
jgi:hypothetical protein